MTCFVSRTYCFAWPVFISVKDGVDLSVVLFKNISIPSFEIVLNTVLRRLASITLCNYLIHSLGIGLKIKSRMVSATLSHTVT